MEAILDCTSPVQPAGKWEKLPELLLCSQHQVQGATALPNPFWTGDAAMEMSKGNPKCPRKPKIPKCAAWGVRETPGLGREEMQPPNPFCPLSAACTRSGATYL